jgi:hypothetical protein
MDTTTISSGTCHGYEVCDRLDTGNSLACEAIAMSSWLLEHEHLAAVAELGGER